MDWFSPFDMDSGLGPKLPLCPVAALAALAAALVTILIAVNTWKKNTNEQESVNSPTKQIEKFSDAEAEQGEKSECSTDISNDLSTPYQLPGEFECHGNLAISVNPVSVDKRCSLKIADASEINNDNTASLASDNMSHLSVSDTSESHKQTHFYDENKNFDLCIENQNKQAGENLSITVDEIIFTKPSTNLNLLLEKNSVSVNSKERNICDNILLDSSLNANNSAKSNLETNIFPSHVKESNFNKNAITNDSENETMNNESNVKIINGNAKDILVYGVLVKDDTAGFNNEYNSSNIRQRKPFVTQPSEKPAVNLENTLQTSTRDILDNLKLSTEHFSLLNGDKNMGKKELTVREEGEVPLDDVTSTGRDAEDDGTAEVQGSACTQRAESLLAGGVTRPPVSVVAAGHPKQLNGGVGSCVQHDSGSCVLTTFPSTAVAISNSALSESYQSDGEKRASLSEVIEDCSDTVTVSSIVIEEKDVNNCHLVTSTVDSLPATGLRCDFVCDNEPNSACETNGEGKLAKDDCEPSYCYNDLSNEKREQDEGDLVYVDSNKINSNVTEQYEEIDQNDRQKIFSAFQVISESKDISFKGSLFQNSNQNEQIIITSQSITNREVKVLDKSGSVFAPATTMCESPNRRLLELIERDKERQNRLTLLTDGKELDQTAVKTANGKPVKNDSRDIKNQTSRSIDLKKNLDTLDAAIKRVQQLIDKEEQKNVSLKQQKNSEINNTDLQENVAMSKDEFLNYNVKCENPEKAFSVTTSVKESDKISSTNFHKNLLTQENSSDNISDNKNIKIEGKEYEKAKFAIASDEDWDLLMQNVLANVSSVEKWMTEEEEEEASRSRAEKATLGNTPRIEGAAKETTAARRCLTYDVTEEPGETRRISPYPAVGDELGSGAFSTMDNCNLAEAGDSAKPASTTPTKIKNLRFKLDPDIYNLPSENGYYEDDEDDNVDYRSRLRPGWRRQPKYYNAFSSLDLGRKVREPVKVVSVRTSVLDAGHKMVVKPIGITSGGQRLTTPDSKLATSISDEPRIKVKQLDIDLCIRLETSQYGDEKESEAESAANISRDGWSASPERQTKRSYLNSSPCQTKKRSPVPENNIYCHPLSPVSETGDWKEGWMTESPDEITDLSTSSEPPHYTNNFSPDSKSWSPHSEPASWPNGILKTCSKKFTVRNEESPNPFVDCSDQRTEDEGNRSNDENQSRYSAARNQSSDALALKEKSGKIGYGVVLSSTTPTRPGSLPLAPHRKRLSLQRKKFVPDPEAIERITGYKAAEKSKPPLPPPLLENKFLLSHNNVASLKNKTDFARKKYFDSKSVISAHKADCSSKFEQFLSQAQQDRARLVTSTPDLILIENAVRSQWSKERKRSNESLSRESTPPTDSPRSDSVARSNTPDDVWSGYVQMLRRQLNRRSRSLCYLETDMDAYLAEDKSCSMSALDESPPESTQSMSIETEDSERLDDSLDDSNRTKSEHELRVEKSLRSLPLPEWFKRSEKPKAGFLLNKKSNEKRGWAAVKSLTSSTTSLSSSGNSTKRAVHSLRTSRENLNWSRGSASPAGTGTIYNRTHNGPSLSLALAKAFREPYLGWRTRTPSSCTSPSPQLDFSSPSWGGMDQTDRSEMSDTNPINGEDEEDTGISFDGEDVIEETHSSNNILSRIRKGEFDLSTSSQDDTCEDVVNISMDTCDPVPVIDDVSKSPVLPGEDTCDDINNIFMDTFELYPVPSQNEERKVSPIAGDDTCDDIHNISMDTSEPANSALVTADRCVSPNPGEDTCNDIKNISTDTSECFHPIVNGHSETNNTSLLKCEDDAQFKSEEKVSLRTVKSEPKLRERCKSSKLISRNDPKRYSYTRSIYHSELNGHHSTASSPVDLDGSSQSLPNDHNCANKVIWIESSFVGSRTTTSIVVLPVNNDTSDGAVKDKKRSSGSNPSVDRPASR